MFLGGSVRRPISDRLLLLLLLLPLLPVQGWSQGSAW
jgi:hypothetical protein